MSGRRGARFFTASVGPRTGLPPAGPRPSGWRSPSTKLEFGERRSSLVPLGFGECWSVKAHFFPPSVGIAGGGALGSCETGGARTSSGQIRLLLSPKPGVIMVGMHLFSLRFVYNPCVLTCTSFKKLIQ
jgi:hypothetical protein